MRKFFKISFRILWLAFLALVLMLVFPLLPFEKNYQIYAVLSGSMEPYIKVGSLIFVKPSTGYEAGDVVTFSQRKNGEIPTTHRIVQVEEESSRKIFSTKGDANDAPDVNQIDEKNILGKVVFTVPFAGYAVDFVKKPLGIALLIFVPAAFIILDELGKIKQEISRMRKKKEAKRRQRSFEKEQFSAPRTRIVAQNLRPVQTNFPKEDFLPKTYPPTDPPQKKVRKLIW